MKPKILAITVIILIAIARFAFMVSQYSQSGGNFSNAPHGYEIRYRTYRKVPPIGRTQDFTVFSVVGPTGRLVRKQTVRHDGESREDIKTGVRRSQSNANVICFHMKGKDWESRMEVPINLQQEDRQVSPEAAPSAPSEEPSS